MVYPGSPVHLLGDLDHDRFPPGDQCHQVKQVGRPRVEHNLHHIQQTSGKGLFRMTQKTGSEENKDDDSCKELAL
jgi:hypothetical protein